MSPPAPDASDASDAGVTLALVSATLSLEAAAVRADGAIHRRANTASACTVLLVPPDVSRRLRGRAADCDASKTRSRPAPPMPSASRCSALGIVFAFLLFRRLQAVLLNALQGKSCCRVAGKVLFQIVKTQPVKYVVKDES